LRARAFNPSNPGPSLTLLLALRPPRVLTSTWLRALSGRGRDPLFESLRELECEAILDEFGRGAEFRFSADEEDGAIFDESIRILRSIKDPLDYSLIVDWSARAVKRCFEVMIERP
jgi:hypothetical protein